MSFDELKKKHAALMQARAQEQDAADSDAKNHEAAMKTTMATVIRPVFEEAKRVLDELGLDADLAEDCPIMDLGERKAIKLDNLAQCIARISFRVPSPSGPNKTVLVEKVPVVLCSQRATRKMFLAAIDVSIAGTNFYTKCAELEVDVTAEGLRKELERVVDTILSHKRL